MAPWRWRLALRRARVQVPLLAIVLALSIISATLLSTLYLLDRATSTFAARAALDDAPAASTQLKHTIDARGPLADIVDASGRAARQGLGDIPASSHVHVEGALQILSLEERYVLTYYAAEDRLDDFAVIVDGRWPDDRTVGVTEVAVPQVLIEDLGKQIGDVLEIRARSYDEEPATTARIVGVYLPIDTTDPLWVPDTLKGDGFRPAVTVPGTGGGLTSPAYGPLITASNRVETLPLDTVTVVYEPDFSSVSVDQLGSVLDSLDDAPTDAKLQLGNLAARVAVFAPVKDTAGQVVSSLAMTRSTVLVTALLLLVVATAALVQAARLVSERRHDERHLVAARGASARQIFTIGAIETGLIGVLTVAVSAPLARLAYLQLGDLPLLSNANLNQDPGLPVGAWVAGGLVALVLITIVLAPLTRRSALIVEAEADRARPGKKAAFQRTGIDAAVIVLAGLAFWQLSMYRSPVVSGEGPPRLDPLLAAGPALALLAGALLAARLVPLAARVMETLATSGRRAVTPLAAWEVARRPVRALSAVLLLTLSLSVGVFAAGFMATWTHSQEDQALYRHPVDAVVTAPSTPWMRQALIVNAPGAQAEPVVADQIEISDRSLGELRAAYQPFSGNGAYLRATTREGWEAFGQGRLAEIRGERLALGLGGTDLAEASSVAVPAGTQAIRMDVTVEPPRQGFVDMLVAIRLLLRSDAGLYHTVDMGVAISDGTSQQLIGLLEDGSTGSSLVGIQTMIASPGIAVVEGDLNLFERIRVTTEMENISALTPVPGWSISAEPNPFQAQPLDISVIGPWTPSATAGYVDDVRARNGTVALTIISSPADLRTQPVIGILTASDLMQNVPIVVTDQLLRMARMSVGDNVTMRVGGALVRANVVAAVPRIGAESSYVVAAPIDTVQVATFQSGGSTIDVDTWWVSTDDVDALTASLPHDAEVSTRQAVVDELTTNPLRVAISVSMWVVAGAAALLAAVGFAVHIVVSTRARALELAQLRAVGLSSGATVRMVGVEAMLLAALGTVCGVGLGLWLVTLTAPLVSFGPDGQPPVPEVLVHVPWPFVAALVLEAVAVVVLALAIAAVLVRRIRPADLLRQGDAR